MFKLAFRKIVYSVLITFFIFSSTYAQVPLVPSTSPYFQIIDEMNKKNYFENINWEKSELTKSISYYDFLEIIYSHLRTRGITVRSVSTLKERALLNTRQQKALDFLSEKQIVLGIKNLGPNSSLRVADAIPMIYKSFELDGAIKPINWPYKDVSLNDLDVSKYAYAVETGAYKPISNTNFGYNNNINRYQFLRLFYVFGSNKSLFPQSKSFVRVNPTQNQIPTVTITINKNKSPNESLDVLQSVWSLLNTRYLYKDNVDFESIGHEAVKKMVESVGDQYTIFYTPDENKVLVNSLENKPFGGIGAQVEQIKDGSIKIISPLRGSPAEEAGLLPGDIIINVNSKSVEGMNINEVVDMIKGPDGSKVTLTIRRNGIDLNITITRAIIRTSTIDIEYVGDGIYYMHISQFTPDSDKLFKEALNKIYKDAGQDVYGNNSNNLGTVEGLILDLRNNPGGFLDATINILSELFPKDKVLLQIKAGNVVSFEKSNNQFPIADKLPIALLINKGSASASEIVAGAIKDQGRGKIFGSTTFGKGTVQQVIDFNDGSALKMTIAEWLSPNGTQINKKGINPDEVFDEITYRDIMTARDSAYNSAYSWLKLLKRRN